MILLPVPGEEDHALTFDSTLRIPLQLYSIFSHFPSSKPTQDQVDSIDRVYPLIPESFNPHDAAYALNEDAMVDWEGHIVEPRRRQRTLLSNIKGNNEMEASALISSSENALIDQLIDL